MVEEEALKNARRTIVRRWRRLLMEEEGTSAPSLSGVTAACRQPSKLSVRSREYLEVSSDRSSCAYDAS